MPENDDDLFSAPSKGIPREDLWAHRFRQMEIFKERYGNCNVPHDFAGGLGKWVTNQRQKKKRDVLQHVREKKLADLGFEWEFRNMVPWEDRFEELKQYKRVHGHCSVPQNQEDGLGIWVSQQRLYKRRGTITPQREKWLTNIGMQWTLYNVRDWDERFVELCDFKKKMHHCNVKARHPGGLGRWVTDQRKKKRSGTLEKARQDKLESIGLKWTDSKVSWELRYHHLTDYKKQHGNCDVPFNYEGGLGNWLCHQKRRRREGKLPEQYIKRLSELGIGWDDKRRDGNNKKGKNGIGSYWEQQQTYENNNEDMNGKKTPDDDVSEETETDSENESEKKIKESSVLSADYRSKEEAANKVVPNVAISNSFGGAVLNTATLDYPNPGGLVAETLNKKLRVKRDTKMKRIDPLNAKLQQRMDSPSKTTGLTGVSRQKSLEGPFCASAGASAEGLAHKMLSSEMLRRKQFRNIETEGTLQRAPKAASLGPKQRVIPGAGILANPAVVGRISKPGQSSNSRSTILHQVCHERPRNLEEIELILRSDPTAARYRLQRDGSARDSVAFPLPKRRKTETLLVGRKKTQYSLPINIALQHGASLKVLDTLIRCAPDVLKDADGPEHECSLHIAIKNRISITGIGLILSFCPESASVLDRYNNTALHAACFYNLTDLRLVRDIYRLFPVAVRKRNFHGRTPLQILQLKIPNVESDALLSFLRNAHPSERGNQQTSCTSPLSGISLLGIPLSTNFSSVVPVIGGSAGMLPRWPNDAQRTPEI